mgnify:FL=1
MATATGMLDYLADQVRGLWGTEYALQKTGYMKSSPGFTGSPKGRIVHTDAVVVVNSGGNSNDESHIHSFAYGAQLAQIPYFVIDCSHQQPQYADPTGGNQWSAAFPANNYVTALSALGGYEVATNCYKTGATYSPNDLLHSPTTAEISGDTSYLDAGKLFRAKTWSGGGNGALAFGTNNICGIVTDGERNVSYGKTQLVFALCFHPGSV